MSRYTVVPGTFFESNTLTLATRLLGTYLATGRGKERTIGRIVETEAYLFKDDPASHAHRGMTRRNAAMFGPAGTVYVYFIYGMHYCMNVVSGEKSIGEAVLIRALEPIAGIPLMMHRRGTGKKEQLCNGPGKLVQALAISVADNGSSLRTGKIRLLQREGEAPPKRSEIGRSARVGITRAVELDYRFYLKESKYISKGAPSGKV